MWPMPRSGNSIMASWSPAFFTPRYDLPIIPVNINCQGPPLTPFAPCVDIWPGPAQGLRSGARAHRAGGYRRNIPLAGHPGFRQDQRGLGPGIPGAVGRQRPRSLLAYTDEQTYFDAGQGWLLRFAPISRSLERRGLYRQSSLLPADPGFSRWAVLSDSQSGGAGLMAHFIWRVLRQPAGRATRPAGPDGENACCGGHAGGVFPDGMRSRAVRCEDFRIGAGKFGYGFLNSA